MRIIHNSYATRALRRDSTTTQIDKCFLYARSNSPIYSRICTSLARSCPHSKLLVAAVVRLPWLAIRVRTDIHFELLPQTKVKKVFDPRTTKTLYHNNRLEAVADSGCALQDQSARTRCTKMTVRRSAWHAVSPMMIHKTVFTRPVQRFIDSPVFDLPIALDEEMG